MQRNFNGLTMTSGIGRRKDEIEAFKKAVVKHLFDGAGATFSSACRTLKMPMSSAYKIRLADPDFAKAIDEARKASDATGGDVAETALMNAIIKGNIVATIFYLKTKHKDRGYVERSELTGAGGVPFRNAPLEGREEEAAAADYAAMVAAGKVGS